MTEFQISVLTVKDLERPGAYTQHKFTVLHTGIHKHLTTETLHIPPRTGSLTESQISVLTVKDLECLESLSSAQIYLI